MSYEQDIKTHGIEEAKFNRAYEDAYDYHFDQVLNDEAFLEQVMMDYFAEEYKDISNLPVFHKQMLWWFSNDTSCKFKDKWIECVDFKTKQLLEG